jgi:hypothetical protein
MKKGERDGLYFRTEGFTSDNPDHASNTPVLPFIRKLIGSQPTPGLWGYLYTLPGALPGLLEVNASGIGRIAIYIFNKIN